MDGTEFYCYLLVSDKRTYIGATVDPDRRLQQHNGMKSGGARATKGKSWNRVCYVSGFPDWTAALQFEWAWKHVSRRSHGVGNKLDDLISLIQRGRSSSSSMPFILWNNHLCIHFTLHDTLFYEKIDKCNLRFSTCACLNTLPLPKTFCAFPFQMSVSEVSSNSISQLASMVEALRAEVTQLKNRLDATLAVSAKKGKVKAAADAPASDAPVADAPAADAPAAPDAPKKQRGRKPKAADAAATTPVQPTQTEVPAAPKKQRKAAKKADASEAPVAAALDTAALDTPDAPAVDAPAANEPKKRGPKAKVPAADLTVALTAAATVATDAPAAAATKVPKKRGPKAKETTA